MFHILSIVISLAIIGIMLLQADMDFALNTWDHEWHTLPGLSFKVVYAYVKRGVYPNGNPWRA